MRAYVFYSLSTISENTCSRHFNGQLNAYFLICMYKFLLFLYIQTKVEKKIKFNKVLYIFLFEKNLVYERIAHAFQKK